MDSPTPSASRRAWRLMAALGCILGATGILLAAILSQRVKHQADRGISAICVIREYGEDTQDSVPNNPSAPPDAVKRFNDLVKGLKDTGVKCPPHTKEVK